MGNDHNKGLPLLSRTTAPGETFPCPSCRTQGIPGYITRLSWPEALSQSQCTCTYIPTCLPPLGHGHCQVLLHGVLPGSSSASGSSNWHSVRSLRIMQLSGRCS